MSQALQQASFRAIGGTTGSYNEDAYAAFEAEATIPAGTSFNGAFIIWLQTRLSSSETSLAGLAQAFAEAEGAYNWSSLGAFDPFALTLAVSIAASADDAGELLSNGTSDITATTFSISNTVSGGFRVETPTLPQGAAIVSTSIQFTAGASNTGTPALVIHGEDADAAAQYVAGGEGTNTISDRSITTASVNWAPGNWTSGDRGAAQLTPDLAAIVQEIVDRPGFDGVLNFIVSATNATNRNFVQFDHATLQEATVTVVYIP